MAKHKKNKKNRRNPQAEAERRAEERMIREAEEAKAAMNRAAAAAAPPPTPTEAEKLIQGDMYYRPLGGNNPDDIGMNAGIVGFDRYGKNKASTRIMIDHGSAMTNGKAGDIEFMMVDTDKYFPDRGSHQKPELPIDAIIITHSHEDHIGGLVHDVNRGKELPPVYATPLAQAFMESQLYRNDIPESDWPEFRTILPERGFQIGDLYVRPMSVSHSVSESQAFAISSPSGAMVHSGDYKSDPTGPIGPNFDKGAVANGVGEALGRYGHERVDLMTIDSTRASNPGYTPPERDVAASIKEEVEMAGDKRAVIAVMGRSTERITEMAKIAAETDRTLVVHGKSILQTLQNLVRADEIRRDAEARMDGREPVSVNSHGDNRINMNQISDILNRITGQRVKIIEGRDDAAMSLPPGKQLALATGTQGEENAALPRAARGDHPTLILGPEDVVIRSASVIPGNEGPIAGVDKGIRSQGVAKLVTGKDRLVHASGHGYAGDVDELLEAVKPRTVAPVHGSEELMRKNAERIQTRADELDLSVQQISNGNHVTVGEELTITPITVPAGYVGMRNTIEDPNIRKFKSDWAYEKVDARGQRLANDNAKPAPAPALKAG